MVKKEPWTHEHAPKTPEHVVGQHAVVERVLKHIQSYKRGVKPLLLWGPTGVGKTSLVHAVASALDRELIEVNASDERGKDAIASVIGQAAFQATLFARERVILIDEVDGISGTSDRGGIPTLLEILPRSSHPVILTANDVSIDKLKPLKKACETLEVKAPSVTEIAGLLSRVAQIEKIDLDADAASGIARRSGGDVRASLNDLQGLAHGKNITHAHLDDLDARDTTAEIEQGISLVLRTTSAAIALPAFDATGEEPGEILNWMDENVPTAYKTTADLARAYDAIARADIFLGRIRRWQHYRYYVYVYNLLTAGIALAKDSKVAGTIDPKRPERFLKIWIANQRNAKRKKLAQVLAPHLHAGVKELTSGSLPYLRHAYQHWKKADQKSFLEKYAIDAETAEWLDK